MGESFQWRGFHLGSLRWPFVLQRREGIPFQSWGKGVVKIDLVIVRLRRVDVVGGLFGEYGGERGVL